MLDWTLFSEWSYWHWLILSVALLLLELFGTAGLLLWTGIAALLTGLMVYLFNLDVYGQWGTFALFSIITTWCWFRFSRQGKSVAAPVLNQRIQRCIGAQTILLEDVKLGKSRVRIDDTVWVVAVNVSATAGTVVHITAADGTLLMAEITA
jgi:membrane protein implicated in regulation of membrane protease activity